MSIFPELPISIQYQAAFGVVLRQPTAPMFATSVLAGNVYELLVQKGRAAGQVPLLIIVISDVLKFVSRLAHW